MISIFALGSDGSARNRGHKVCFERGADVVHLFPEAKASCDLLKSRLIQITVLFNLVS